MGKSRSSPAPRNSSTPPRTPTIKRSKNARVLLLIASWAIAGSGFSWPADAYKNMAYDTVRLLPPALSRVLWRHEDALVASVRRLDVETASRLAGDAAYNRLSQETLTDIDARISRIVTMIDSRRPFRDVSVEFGSLLRVAADLSDPMLVGASDPEFARVSAEYRRFVELNLHQVPLVHDKHLPHPLEGSSLADLLHETRSSTAASLGDISSAFWRDGRIVPAESFDFRSVPYARFSLAYSRSVTAASYLWLTAWSRANGDFTGYRFGTPKKQ